MTDGQREIVRLRAQLAQAIQGLQRIASMTTGESVDLLWAGRDTDEPVLEDLHAYGRDQARCEIGAIVREELRNLGWPYAEDHRELIERAREAGFEYSAYDPELNLTEAEAARDYLEWLRGGEAAEAA